jgi:hypothetical protein
VELGRLSGALGAAIQGSHGPAGLEQGTGGFAANAASGPNDQCNALHGSFLRFEHHESEHAPEPHQTEFSNYQYLIYVFV